jgi:glycerol kinase
MTIKDAPVVLSIDQGTTSTRSIVFDTAGRPLASAQQEFSQIFPHGGWVEHDPEEIWASTLTVCRKALEALSATDARLETIGITNQRETTLVWDRKTGKPVYNAIVWQDRRTASHCDALKKKGHETRVSAKTGLVLDPYFSATKIAWILDNVDGARTRAEAGELAFGTVDSFLLWRLSGGRAHATDATNASRTLLFDIHTQRWDEELLDLFGVPRAMMPEVLDSAADFGRVDGEFRDAMPTSFRADTPINGIAGDQQAAAVGQTCLAPGMMKSTYGTGCFALLNTGDKAFQSKNRLLTTVAYRLGGEVCYALEGSIFMAGAAVQWLRDGLKVIENAAQTEDIVHDMDGNKGVYLVPAFTGLGAPHWDPHARAAIFGLTRDSGPAELVRATLESVCYQTRDLCNAMSSDGAITPKTIRVDGGMVANNWMMQFLADILDVAVERPMVTETTALGAAYLAGVQCGIFESLDALANMWQRERRFDPSMGEQTRTTLLATWDCAVAQTRGFHAPT